MTTAAGTYCSPPGDAMNHNRYLVEIIVKLIKIKQAHGDLPANR
jgi:hypothetical protein